MILIEILRDLSSVIGGFWVYACLVMAGADILGRGRPRIAKVVWQEFRPFYLAAISVELATEVTTGNFGGFMDPLNAAASYWAWWLFKDMEDPDDRWKRRKNKLAERVSLVGGRLRVVPVTR